MYKEALRKEIISPPELLDGLQKKGVEVFGTIGLLDKLYDGDYINKLEYQFCLENLLEHKERRLPAEELQKRINSL